jgi:hypothetical protein
MNVLPVGYKIPHFMVFYHRGTVTKQYCPTDKKKILKKMYALFPLSYKTPEYM